LNNCHLTVQAQVGVLRAEARPKQRGFDARAFWSWWMRRESLAGQPESGFPARAGEPTSEEQSPPGLSAAGPFGTEQALASPAARCPAASGSLGAAFAGP